MQNKLKKGTAVFNTLKKAPFHRQISSLKTQHSPEYVRKINNQVNYLG
jgi:hypothetical protein